MNQLGARLGIALGGLILIAGGLAVAADFRGFVTWHTRWSVRTFLSKKMAVEKRVEQHVATVRVSGVIVMVMGVACIVAAFIGHDIH